MLSYYSLTIFFAVKLLSTHLPKATSPRISPLVEATLAEPEVMRWGKQIDWAWVVGI